MAVLNGKLYFSWVQCFRLCIPDFTRNAPTRKTAISKWQLAIGQTLPRKQTFVFLRVLCGKWFPVFSVSQGLRSGHFILIGGRA